MGIRCSSPSLLLYGIQGIWLFSTIDSVAQALSASKDSNSDEHKSNTQPCKLVKIPVSPAPVIDMPVTVILLTILL